MAQGRLCEPLFLKPIFVERLWGGRRLAELLGKAAPPEKRIGESWEVADRPEAQSLVDGGAHDGATLHDLMQAAPVALLGPELAARKPPRFPLLSKFLDARERLSLQVHPDDAGAKTLGLKDRGKSECWVIVHAEAGASVARGLREGVTREAFARAVAEDRVEELARCVPVAAGDVILVPPGMLHALGAGIVAAELGQNSDLTFRVYDYGRKDERGAPRPLHLKEALATLRFEGRFGDEFAGDMRRDKVEIAAGGFRGKTGLVGCATGKRFNVQMGSVKPGETLRPERKPQAPVLMMALQGQGRLGERPFGAGRSILIPAGLSAAGSVEVKAVGREQLIWVEAWPTPEA